MSDSAKPMPIQIAQSTIDGLAKQEDTLKKLRAVMEAQKAAGLNDPQLEGLIKQAEFMLKAARQTVNEVLRGT